ncbi:hypothetical protein TTHERM_00049189 (macronuclear) [Tetrahymena thermophila SB210]|uniref:Uncharacterized protein n=1 Tax=Tetrahymena thermophila (strain SB210) TaxID=312017 RepID=A4VE13_TETTS|nr:hypothetical protein TTHERM_00049189 [Tetrahymena thermophila SB210]EDK31772.2 hypothetical protein TTHERM_00049189 [Tetrahymena thermophila SB210]|eukprot:XP_001471326.2 hypothetical protein TTHERM_00049189 [Tetrahymena thermophila SB210]
MQNKEKFMNSLTQCQRKELEEFQMRIQKAQEDSTKQTTGMQIVNNFKAENEQSSKIKSYQGQEYLKNKNASVDINTCIQSPLNTDKEKFGLDSLKSPWSILKLENTGSNFNNTSQMNTLSLIGENRMTPKDFDELLYIKKVNHYNQLSNVNAEQMLKKMQSNTDSSHVLLKNSSKKEFLPVELDQDIQNKSQQQIIQQEQDKSQLNNYFNNGQSNISHPNSQVKSRLQVKSIKMYETENSFVQPKRLNLDSSFQRKSNFSIDKENQNNNQNDQTSEKFIESQNMRQEVSNNQQYLNNLLAGDKLEFKQQNNSSKNIELIPPEIAQKRENPFRNQNQQKDVQTQNSTKYGKLQTIENQDLKKRFENKLIGEHKRSEDDQMITSTSSSGVKRVQFSMDVTTAHNQNMKEKQSQELKNILFQNQKIQSDPQFQIQQQYKNNTTNNFTNQIIQKKNSFVDIPQPISNPLLNNNNNNNTSFNQSNQNIKSNSSYLSASNNINSNNAMLAAINMDRSHSSSFNNFILNNANESNKQLIQALSNLKNEYRRSFYSRQIDSILEEKVRQHHSRENSRDKLQIEGLNNSKNELHKRPLTAKLIQSTLHRKNSLIDKQQNNKFQNTHSNQDSKLNHPGDSFGHQSTISVIQNKNNINSNQYREKNSKHLNNLSLSSAKQLEINEKAVNNESLSKVNALNNITFSKIQTSKSNIDISSPKEIDSALNKKINLDNSKDIQLLFNLIRDHVQKCPNFCNEISKFLE